MNFTAPRESSSVAMASLDMCSSAARGGRSLRAETIDEGSRVDLRVDQWQTRLASPFQRGGQQGAGDFAVSQPGTATHRFYARAPPQESMVVPNQRTRTAGAQQSSPPER